MLISPTNVYQKNTVLDGMADLIETVKEIKEGSSIPYLIIRNQFDPRSKMKCNTTIVLDVKTSETSGVAYEKISSIAI